MTSASEADYETNRGGWNGVVSVPSRLVQSFGGNRRFVPKMAVPIRGLIAFVAAAACIASGTNVAARFGVCKCKTQKASVRHMVCYLHS